jgi:hypothetical protein
MNLWYLHPWRALSQSETGRLSPPSHHLEELPFPSEYTRNSPIRLVNSQCPMPAAVKGMFKGMFVAIIADMKKTKKIGKLLPPPSMGYI